MRTHFFKLAIALCLTLAVGGCARLNSGVFGTFNLDTDLRLEFEVASNINPDERQSPSPVFVRLYELRSDKRFAQGDFFDLYHDAKAVLGDDLISSKELHRLVPGETRSERLVLNPETRYVALFAEFYQYKDARNKVVFAVTPQNVVQNTARIQIERNIMTLRTAH